MMKLKNILNKSLRKKGFTLIEIIVSIAILAVISVIILYVFLASSSVTDQAEKFSNSTLSNMSALERVLGSTNIVLDATTPEADVDFGTGDNRDAVNVKIDEEGIVKEFTFKDNSGVTVSKIGVKGDVYESKKEDDDEQGLKAFSAYEDGFTVLP